MIRRPEEIISVYMALAANPSYLLSLSHGLGTERLWSEDGDLCTKVMGHWSSLSEDFGTLR
jgi:hypothetical protein